MKSGTPIQLGQTVATPGALALLEQYDMQPSALLGRHVHGDWGTCYPEDAAANDRAAINNDDRIMSTYYLKDGDEDTRIWIITEWDRSVTTLLLPEEY